MIIQNKNKGTYILILRLTQDRCLQIGKLGNHVFSSGHYGYVGSAFGPGGLNARLQHHLRKSSRPRWHIDYLRKEATVLQAWYSDEIKRMEHEWASVLASMPGVITFVKGFGSTDCNCRSHLFLFDQPASASFFQKFANRSNRLNRKVKLKSINFE